MTKIPTNAAHVQKYFLGNKQSIMKNVPVPSTQMNCAMTLIKAQEKNKNVLMIGYDLCLIKHKLDEDEINSMNNNFIGQGKGIQDEIKQLPTQCVEVDDDIHMSLYKKIRDGVFPYATTNSNKRILLHTFSLQQNDSRIDSSLHTCPAGLGHKSKLSIIE